MKNPVPVAVGSVSVEIIWLGRGGVKFGVDSLCETKSRGKSFRIISGRPNCRPCSPVFREGDVRRRRQKIPRRPFEIADASGGNLIRPVNDHRHAQVVGGNDAVKKVRIHRVRFLRNRCAGEKNRRVVGHAELLQLLLQLRDVAVEPRDHRRLVLCRLRPGFLRERRVGRHLAFAVAGNLVIQQQEKRLVAVELVGLVVFDEIQRGLGEHVGNVFALRAAEVGHRAFPGR